MIVYINSYAGLYDVRNGSNTILATRTLDLVILDRFFQADAYKNEILSSFIPASTTNMIP